MEHSDEQTLVNGRIASGMFLLCAVNGRASHLLSYDPHLLSLRPYYSAEMTICEPVEFLTECRKLNPGSP